MAIYQCVITIAALKSDRMMGRKIKNFFSSYLPMQYELNIEFRVSCGVIFSSPVIEDFFNSSPIVLLWNFSIIVMLGLAIYFPFLVT